ncbi:MAG: hypothetical protein GXO09_04825 [Crenarchaeota archaeon]|nr:hypothetical protein [Thermoproteota archaeon]
MRARGMPVRVVRMGEYIVIVTGQGRAFIPREYEELAKEIARELERSSGSSGDA